MSLHRDIHWIGRQWAVTGHGMQLIDQKLKGFFDIEASQLWEEALIETMRAKEWLNGADFDKGLEVARKRFPRDGVAPSPQAETIVSAPPVAPKVIPAAAAIAPIIPPSVVAPPIAPVEPLPQVHKPVVKPAEPMRLRIDPVRPRPAPPPPAPKPAPPPPATLQAPAVTTPEPEVTPTVPPTFHMLFSGNAKFLHPWRVRVRK
jgi:hypothetical protein